MNSKLQKIFHQLESEKNELFTLLATMPEKKLTEVPATGGWTILQIVAHLITSEKLSTAYMKKKSIGIDTLDNSGFVETIKMVMLKFSQRLPFKFKAPAIVVQHTVTAQSLTELKTQWDEVRAELKNVMETIAEKNVRKKIYKHPIVGRLDSAQAMTFFREHFYHHYPQIKRLL